MSSTLVGYLEYINWGYPEYIWVCCMVVLPREHGDIRCTVSSLVVRANSKLLKSAVIDVNNVLRDSLPQDVNFVEHSNITNYHFSNSRLHLNRRGDAALAHNFIQHIRSSNC